MLWACRSLEMVSGANPWPIDLHRGRNRLILSEKAATQELRRQRKARAAAELNVGDILEGVVTHVTGG